MWPFARCCQLGTHCLQPGQREHFGPGGSSPGGKVDAEASTVRKRLQQATNVARKRDTGTKCRHGCRHLQRLTVIDAIGNRVIVAAAGDAGSRDHQFGPTAAQRIESFIADSLGPSRENVVAVAIGE
jgi:hypothetical protein